MILTGPTHFVIIEPLYMLNRLRSIFGDLHTSLSYRKVITIGSNNF